MTSVGDHPGDAAGGADRRAIAIAGPHPGPAAVGGWKGKPEGVRKQEGNGNVIEPSRMGAFRQGAWGVKTEADALLRSSQAMPAGTEKRKCVSPRSSKAKGQLSLRLEPGREARPRRREVLGTNPECALKSIE